MTSATLDELTAMVEQQDRELEAASAALRRAAEEWPDARFDVAPAFLDELEELCRPRCSTPPPLTFALRV